MVTATDSLNEAAVWAALETVKDPEIPTVSVVGMGIVRAVSVSGGEVLVKMTPTFSGCPALHVMRQAITACVHALGADEVTVEIVLYPPWTTDWINDEARASLKAFGLSPPPQHGGNLAAVLGEVVPCPYCDSVNTSVKNSFGPTLCRAIHYCQDCQQPFEQFKPL